MSGQSRSDRMSPAGAGSVPVPDPTVLTTAALLREIEREREARRDENQALRQIIEARLDGNDTAVKLQFDAAAAANAKTEASVAKQIDQIKDLIAATTKAGDGKIDDVKTRLTVIESRNQTVLVILSTLIAIGALAVAVIKST